VQPRNPPTEVTTRRRWLDWLLGTSLGAVALAVLYPVFRFVIPPEEGLAEEDRVRAATVDELPPNSGKIFRFGAAPAVVVRTPAGDLRAFSAVCTHLSCTVQYRSDLRHIWCPCHDGHFDLNGVPVAGPPPRALEQYEVAVEGGVVWVMRRG
jgi:cytochrome b6-f complex iron-sulfur subunit